MNKRQAIENQTRIAKQYDLGHWYGVSCRKCCEVFPKLMTAGNGDCYYQCEVCGRRTKQHTMPWLAREEWNSMDRQMSIFDFVEE